VQERILAEAEIIAVREKVREAEDNDRCCGIVSEELAGMIPGAQEFYGAYITADDTFIEDHAWVDLPGGRILDATVDQFNEGEDVRIVGPESERYKCYLRNW
jgi:hypothetical protein